MSSDLLKLTTEKASKLLFNKCVELLLAKCDILCNNDPTIKVLTQRLYGDYRLLHLTSEYKKALNHVEQFTKSGLGRELL